MTVPGDCEPTETKLRVEAASARVAHARRTRMVGIVLFICFHFCIWCVVATCFTEKTLRLFRVLEIGAIQERAPGGNTGTSAGVIGTGAGARRAHLNF